MNLQNTINMTNASVIHLSKQGVIGREVICDRGKGKIVIYMYHFLVYFLLLSCFYNVLIAELLYILTWKNFVMYTDEYVPFFALIV